MSWPVSPRWNLCSQQQGRFGFLQWIWHGYWSTTWWSFWVQCGNMGWPFSWPLVSKISIWCWNGFCILEAPPPTVLFHRYGTLFGSGIRRIWASVGFGVSWCLLVHVSFQNEYQSLTSILTCNPFNACRGQAQNSAESVPFVVTDDRGLLIQVDGSGKEVRSLAEIVCWVTKTRGVCDVKLKNHTLTQKLQVGLSRTS